VKTEVAFSYEVRKVLRVFLGNPKGEHYGLELAKAARVPDGSIYPILARLERAGLVGSYVEEIDPTVEKRRPRRYYRLTAKGVTVAKESVAEVRRFFGLLKPQTDTR
jgi:DNA-binding PadR family transcriptional regulator